MRVNKRALGEFVLESHTKPVDIRIHSSIPGGRISSQTNGVELLATEKAPLVAH